MKQHSFDFAPLPIEGSKETQQWVDHHNQQVTAAARIPSIPPSSLLSAIDGTEAKSNAVYLLRGVLSQILRKSSSAGTPIFKRQFLQGLRAEIQIKKTSQDPAFSLRNVLISTHPTR